MAQTTEANAPYEFRPPENDLVDAIADDIWRTTEMLAMDPDFYQVVRETPLLVVAQEALPQDLRNSGYTLLVKHEGMQPTEAYKLRGAMSALLGHNGSVVAASTGNHASAVAYAANCLGIGPVDVMCPTSTNQAKLDNMG